MPRYFLEIAYDGSAYHGWQVQPNANSVQAEIEKALGMLLGAEVKVMGCGRTDTGVHAEQFFLHFDADKLDEKWLQWKMDQLLPGDIAVFDCLEVEAEAHARFDATSRSYRYDIHLRKSPFLRQYSTQIFWELDIDKMNTCAQMLLGQHEFDAFCKVGSDIKTTQCDVTEARWVRVDDRMHFHISADRFLRNMVRAVVGTLIDVGRGKIDEKQFEEIFVGRDRSAAGQSADARGLYLTKVTYPFL